MKNRKNYALHEGMVLEREFYGRLRKLHVVRDDNTLKFKIGDKLFLSLTAAARYVVRDETRQINGPEFWGAPLAEGPRTAMSSAEIFQSAGFSPSRRV